jgi:tetratricopeptide (TPR) repeat protein
VSIREARELWKSFDNRVMLSDSLGSESEAYFNEGEFEQALQCSQQALQISEEINNLWGQAYESMLIAFVHFQSGRLGQGIQFAERGSLLGDQAGMIAINTMRCELAWIYTYCGAYEKGFALIDHAVQQAQMHQPAWATFPQAVKVRMHLLRGEIESAEKIRGNEILKPISIPYARFTTFLGLANIELAVAKRQYDDALALTEDLLEEVASLTRVDTPEALRWKGIALIGLGQLDEALQTLTEAWSLARKQGAILHLLPLAINLAEVNSKLGNQKEAQQYLAEGRRFAEQMAESLREIGLADSFLYQPRVRKLMRE